MNYTWVILSLGNEINVKVLVSKNTTDTPASLREKALNKLARTIYNESEGVDK